MNKLSTRLAGFVIEIDPPVEDDRLVGHFDNDEFMNEIFDAGAKEVEMTPHSGSYYVTFQDISIGEALFKVAECKRIALKHLKFNK